MWKFSDRVEVYLASDSSKEVVKLQYSLDSNFCLSSEQINTLVDLDIKTNQCMRLEIKSSKNELSISNSKLI